MERLKIADLSIKKSVNLQYLKEIDVVLKIFNINDKYNLFGEYEQQFLDFQPYLQEMVKIENDLNIKLNLKKGNLNFKYIISLS